MGETIATYSRATEGLEGVTATVEGGRIVKLEGDRRCPKSAGLVSPLCTASASMPQHPRRYTQPMRRNGDTLTPASWDEALSDIAARLTAIRAASGPNALGLYAGSDLAYNTTGAIRTAAFALGNGTPNLFSPLTMYGAGKLYAAELVLGAPIPLQADVGRAHTTVLLGSDQDECLWGPFQSGSIHSQALDYFRNRRKQNKILAVDPRSTPRAQRADEHLKIRAGTELYFLLGIAHSLLLRNWTDTQYLRDYCSNVDRLRGWLEPWTPPRCAEICGIDAGELAGVALKMSRAAMAVVAMSAQACQTQHATVTAWAHLIVHALSANLLRPGGLFDAHGLVDLYAAYTALPTERAPRTRVGNYPALWLQSPGTVLADEALQGGEGQLKALIAVAGCPISDLPAPQRTRDALRGLDLLVALDSMPSATTELAHWILPTTHFWERADLHLLDHATLPTRSIQATRAVLPPAGECRTEADILGDLANRLPIAMRGAWGPHMRLLGRHLATSPLEPWVDRALGWNNLPSFAQLQEHGGAIDHGELDRANWRLSTADGRMDLAPAALTDAVMGLTPPVVDPQRPLRLMTSVALSTGRGAWLRTPDAREPGIQVHPDLGLKDGAEAIIDTAYGEARGPVRLDPGLRPDTAVVPWGWAVDAASLIGPDPLDPFVGTPAQNGLACRVRSAK